MPSLIGNIRIFKELIYVHLWLSDRSTGVIPTRADQNRWAQSREPMDMMVQG